MRLLEREMPLDPEVERELGAIDRALAGEPVDPDLEVLARAGSRAALRASRAGRRGRRQARRAGRGRVPSPHVGPPRAPAPAGLGRFPAGARAGGAAPASCAGRGERVRGRDRGRGLAERGSAGRRERTTQTAAAAWRSSAAAPPAATAPPVADPGTGAREATPTVRNSSKTERFTQHFERASKPSAADLSAGRNERKVAQSVDLSLSTSPDDFRDAADGVLDVVRDHRGFVVRSNVSGGDPRVRGSKRGRASFTLRIPAGELSAAMGDLSDLGHVVSRSDGSVDITNRFVSARKRIDALTASRDQLLQELGQAVTITEQQSIRARLRIVQAQLAGAHHDLARAHAARPPGPGQRHDRRRRGGHDGRGVDDRRRLPRRRAACSRSPRARLWWAGRRCSRSSCSGRSPPPAGASGCGVSATGRSMPPRAPARADRTPRPGRSGYSL